MGQAVAAVPCDCIRRASDLESAASIQAELRAVPLDTLWKEIMSKGRLNVKDPSYMQVLSDFQCNCAAWADSYRFKLEVFAIYRIQNEVLEKSFQRAVSAMQSAPNVHVLYHGTSVSSAKAIAAHGFALPDHAGMFGKGVYFAQTPLKCWRYATTNGSRYILVCDVALGSVKISRKAAPEIGPEQGLQRSWLLKLFGAVDFDSLMAPPRQKGGSVNVPEYTLYNQELAIPRYILELREVSRC